MKQCRWRKHVRMRLDISRLYSFATPSHFLEIDKEVLAIALFPFESTFNYRLFRPYTLEIIPLPLVRFLTSSVSEASTESTVRRRLSKHVICMRGGYIRNSRECLSSPLARRGSEGLNAERMGKGWKGTWGRIETSNETKWCTRAITSTRERMTSRYSSTFLRTLNG